MIFKHIDSPSKQRMQSRMTSFNRRESMIQKRRDNEASSLVYISVVVEAADDSGSNSPCFMKRIVIL